MLIGQRKNIGLVFAWGLNDERIGNEPNEELYSE